MLESVTAQNSRTTLRPILPRDTLLCADGRTALAAAAKRLDIEHHSINISTGVRITGAWHLQNVNASGSRLRNWLVRFKGEANRYPANYLGWFRALDRAPGFAPRSSLLSLSEYEFNNIIR